MSAFAEMSEGSESGKINAETWKKLTPMHRFAKPREIADHITWMASPYASFQTGGDVVVDGGCESILRPSSSRALSDKFVILHRHDLLMES